MKTTWYDTLKYWNGKEILRECKDKNRLCVHANVWNTCVDKPCEKGDPMTNREWLESLDNSKFAVTVTNPCSICRHDTRCDLCGDEIGNDMMCFKGITQWLEQKYEEPKKELTQAQLCEAFELKFGKRRAISLDEVREVTKEIFK